MDDLISRQAAIDALANLVPHAICDVATESYTNGLTDAYNLICQLPPAQPDNQTNLCDSCNYSYPDCPSKNDDVIFGNGIGNDNICACNKYKPSAHPERKKGRWISLDDFRGRYNEFGYKCSECGEQSDYEENYCPNCGVDMQTRDEGKECLETK